MFYFSKNREINDFCNELVNSHLWEYSRRGKHISIKRTIKKTTLNLTVPTTPSDPDAALRFRNKYRRLIRQYLIDNNIISA